MCGYGVAVFAGWRWRGCRGMCTPLSCFVVFRVRTDVRAHPEPYRTALADDGKSSIASVASRTPPRAPRTAAWRQGARVWRLEPQIPIF